MPSFPPVQSVKRALGLLAELNKQRVTTVGELHHRTGLPKPTIVRLLETLMASGYVASDHRLRGYQVTSQVATLSSGFHGAPMEKMAAQAAYCAQPRRKSEVVSGIAELVPSASSSGGCAAG